MIDLILHWLVTLLLGTILIVCCAWLCGWKEYWKTFRQTWPLLIAFPIMGSIMVAIAFFCPEWMDRPEWMESLDNWLGS